MYKLPDSRVSHEACTFVTCAACRNVLACSPVGWKMSPLIGAVQLRLGFLEPAVSNARLSRLV